MEYLNGEWIKPYIIPRPEKGLAEITAAAFWRSTLMSCVPVAGFDSIFNIPLKNGFCFLGDHGTGKHYVAKAFAGSIPEDEYISKNYVTCLVSGSHLERETLEETEMRVRTLFRSLMVRPAVLIIDSLHTERLRSLIAAEYEHCRAEYPFTLFVIEDEEEAVWTRWERNLMVCRFYLPDSEARENFFRENGNNIPVGSWTADGAAWAARHTEGMNYSQLRTLIQLCNTFMKAKTFTEFDGDFDRTVEACSRNEVKFKKEDMMHLLNAVQVRFANEQEAIEEMPEEKQDKEPVHLIIDNMPEIIRLPGQMQVPDQEQQLNPDSKSASHGKEPAGPALTDEEAEAEILNMLKNMN